MPSVLDSPSSHHSVMVGAFHGGQEWRKLRNYVEDFSVTTNFLGPSKLGLEAAANELKNIEHYPPQDFEPTISDLCGFLIGKPNSECSDDGFDSSEIDCMADLVTLGNGASELIDLVVRLAPAGPFRSGPSVVQYKEYERSAATYGRVILPSACKAPRVKDGSINEAQDALQVGSAAGGSTCAQPGLSREPTSESLSACISGSRSGSSPNAPTAGHPSAPVSHHSSGGITCIVNPCNPTGDFLPVEKLKAYVESHAPQDSFVIVDESMLPWVGSEWRSESLVGQREWVLEMVRERGVAVFVIHSWTKLWACPGLRLGSVVCPSLELAAKVKAIQVPWSVNLAALAYLSAVIKDDEYLRETWELTTPLRAQMADTLLAEFPSWRILGEKWLSWLWVDCGSETSALAAVASFRALGIPIRWGGNGYEMHTFVRIGVRKNKHIPLISRALKLTREHIAELDARSAEIEP